MGLFILHPRASPEKAERIANIYQESRDNYAAVSRMNQSSETKKSKANKHSIRHNKTYPISESTSLLYESTQSTTVSNDLLTLPTSIFAEDYKKQNHRWHRRRNLPNYTLSDVQKHNTSDSCWIIVDNLVLDVTKFISYHPGSTTAILKHGGTFCDEHIQYHSKNAKELCWKFVIGKLMKKSNDHESNQCDFNCIIM